MDIKKRIESYIREAGIYRSQGLFQEARESYMNAGQLIKKYDKTAKNKNLLHSISEKINNLNDEIFRIENTTSTPAMSEEVQDIIKKKFSFSKDNDAADLEGAIALAKFGQFERALEEFQRLIKRKPVRVDAAKNIIRCHMALDSIDNAVDNYRQWLESGFFGSEQLNKLRIFLQGIMKKKGINKSLPQIEAVNTAEEPARESEDAEPEEIQNQEILDIDISSVGITFEKGPRKGETVEFDVSFQSGNMINLLIPTKDEELVEHLNAGLKLDNVQFYSPIAMFSGKGSVASKSKIESGPKKGDYSVDIQIRSI